MSIKVSICIPSYNRAKYLGRCLRSIIDQSFPRKNYEIILIDDCSKDDTSSIVKAFEDEIVLLKNKKRLGLPKSLNKAINIAKGKYFLRLDSDDYVNKDFIDFLFKFIEYNKEFNAASCDYYVVDESEKVIKKMNCERYPIGCGIIFRIDDLKRVGKYNENIKIFEDKDIIKKLKRKKFKMIRVAIPLYRYRKHKSNLTKNKNDIF